MLLLTGCLATPDNEYEETKVFVVFAVADDDAPLAPIQVI